MLIWVRLDGDAAPGPGLTVAAEPTEAECRRPWTGGSTGPGMTPTVAAFAGRQKDGVDLDSVRDDLAGVVQHALEPAHVSVWISQRD